MITRPQITPASSSPAGPVVKSGFGIDQRKVDWQRGVMDFRNIRSFSPPYGCDNHGDQQQTSSRDDSSRNHDSIQFVLSTGKIILPRMFRLFSTQSPPRHQVFNGTLWQPPKSRYQQKVFLAAMPQNVAFALATIAGRPAKSGAVRRDSPSQPPVLGRVPQSGLKIRAKRVSGNA